MGGSKEESKERRQIFLDFKNYTKCLSAESDLQIGPLFMCTPMPCTELEKDLKFSSKHKSSENNLEQQKQS